MTKFIQENLFQQYNDQQLKYRMYVHLIVPIAGFATHFPAFDRGITNVTRMQHTRYRKMQKLLTTNICTLFKLDFWISWNFQWHEKKERKTHKVVKKQEKNLYSCFCWKSCMPRSWSNCVILSRRHGNAALALTDEGTLQAPLLMRATGILTNYNTKAYYLFWQSCIVFTLTNLKCVMQELLIPPTPRSRHP